MAKIFYRHRLVRPLIGCEGLPVVVRDLLSLLHVWVATSRTEASAYHASISANFAVWFELIEALPGLDAYRTITEASCDVVANPSASLTLRTEFRVVDSVA